MKRDISSRSIIHHYRREATSSYPHQHRHAILLIEISPEHRTNHMIAVLGEKRTAERRGTQIGLELVGQRRQAWHGVIVTDDPSGGLPDIILRVEVGRCRREADNPTIPPGAQTAVVVACRGSVASPLARMTVSGASCAVSIRCFRSGRRNRAPLACAGNGRPAWDADT